MMKYAGICLNSVPKAGQINQNWTPHWNHIGPRGLLLLSKQVFLNDQTIIIPTYIRLDILDKIHAGHEGSRKFRERVRDSVWWPGLRKQIEDMVTFYPSVGSREINTKMARNRAVEKSWAGVQAQASKKLQLVTSCFSSTCAKTRRKSLGDRPECPCCYSAEIPRTWIVRG